MLHADTCCCNLAAAERVSAGFFCLRGFDLKGDPASSGDAEAPVQSANTEIAGMTPSTCATACKGTAGCQFMLIKKPATPGGTSTCYLKMHPLGGQYGNTGPSADTDFTCFNGQDTWVTFGGQLDYFLPSPVVNTGVETPALASIAPTLGAGNDTGAKTYRCIKQYSINGTVLSQAQVRPVCLGACCSVAGSMAAACCCDCDATPCLLAGLNGRRGPHAVRRQVRRGAGQMRRLQNARDRRVHNAEQHRRESPTACAVSHLHPASAAALLKHCAAAHCHVLARAVHYSCSGRAHVWAVLCEPAGLEQVWQSRCEAHMGTVLCGSDAMLPAAPCCSAHAVALCAPFAEQTPAACTA